MIKITVSGWWFGTMEFYDFPYIYIGNVIIPTDFHSIIFQRGRYTTNQVCNVGNTITNHPWLGMVYTTYKNGDIWDSLWHCFAHIILHLRTKPHPEDLWKNYRKHKNAAISSVSFPESQPWDPKTCNQMLICLICFFNPITNSCIITWICDWMCSVWVSRGPFFFTHVTPEWPECDQVPRNHILQGGLVRVFSNFWFFWSFKILQVVIKMADVHCKWLSNLIGGLEPWNFICPYIGNNHSNWLSYFSEGLMKPPTRNGSSSK